MVAVLARPLQRPARRLRVATRIVLLTLLLVVPAVLGTGAYAAQIGGQISFSERERAGVEVARPALAALISMVQQGSADLAAVTAQVRAHPELRLDAAWQKVGAAGPAGGQASVAALTDFLVVVGNQSNLILDPDLDSFYVMDATLVQLPAGLSSAALAAQDPSGDRNAQVARQAVLAGALHRSAAAITADVTTAAEQTERRGLPAEL